MTHTVCFVYPGHSHSANESSNDFGHPAHRGFQESIGADSIVLPATPNIPLPFLRDLWAGYKADIPQYDVFIFENAAALYAAPFIRRKYPSATFILLADTDLFDPEMHGFDNLHSVKSVVRYFDRLIDYKIIREILPHLDGILATSDLVEDYINISKLSLPSRVVYPYIQPTVDNSLATVSPNYRTNNIVTISEARPHKGVDILVEAFAELQPDYPQSTLHVVGKGHPDEYAETPNVKIWGYVDDLTDVLQQASVYVHPARCEAFGVTVIEAMAAGLVPIVTEQTGAQIAVEKIDSEFIVPAAPTDVARVLRSYFDFEPDDREKLGKQAREVAAEYSKPNRLQHFRNQYQDLLQECDKK